MRGNEEELELLERACTDMPFAEAEQLCLSAYSWITQHDYHSHIDRCITMPESKVSVMVFKSFTGEWVGSAFVLDYDAEPLTCKAETAYEAFIRICLLTHLVKSAVGAHG